MKIAVLLVTIALLSSVLSGCSAVKSPPFSGSQTSTSASTSTGSVPPDTSAFATATTSNSTRGLSLALSVDSASVPEGEDIKITVDEQNTLAVANNVTAANNWVIKGLTLGP